MIRPDSWIAQMARDARMIEPFASSQVKKANISYGLSSYGYDVRIADEFKLLRPQAKDFVVDPKALSDAHFSSCTVKEYVILPPTSFALGRSVEYFRIPRNVLALCFGKSTYARSGIIVNITPLEPEWEGFITISIANTSSHPAKVYAGEGIAQIVFLESVDACGVSYKDRKGRYQAQAGITLPKV